MKKIMIPVFKVGSLTPDTTIEASDIDTTGNAEPTSRCLSGSADGWAAEEWVEPAITVDGQACRKFYLFAADEVDGLDPEQYPWDDSHVVRIELDQMLDITSIIDRAGGQTAFSRLHDIPLRTVQDWYHNRRNPSAWLINILDRITE